MDGAWADTLLMRAERARPTEAVRMLEHAVVILGTLQDRAGERDALFLLAKALESAGRSRDALLSLQGAHFLKDSLAAVELTLAAAGTEQRIAEAQVMLERALEQQAEERRAEQEKHRITLIRLESWLMAAGIFIALLLGALVWSWVQLARHRRGSRPVVPHLEVPIAQEIPKRKVLRPAPPLKEPTPAPPVVPADPEAAMLLGLFHKHIPERLRTLKEARERGDHEKVVRVLASMRPQLAQHDATRFSERCAGLIASREAVLGSAHSLELDGLIADVEQALRESGGDY